MWRKTHDALGDIDLGVLECVAGESFHLGEVELSKIQRDESTSGFHEDKLSSETAGVSCRIVELEAFQWAFNDNTVRTPSLSGPGGEVYCSNADRYSTLCNRKTWAGLEVASSLHRATSNGW